MIVTTADSTILEVNESIERISGYKPEEVLGKTTDDLNFWVAKADRARYRALIQKQGAVYNFEAKYRKRSGEIIDALLFGSSISLESGPLFLAVVHDISDLKRSEEDLRRTNAFVTMIIENIPDMIFLKSASDLRFIRFNRAGEELLGYTRDDLLGKSDYDFFTKEEADFFSGKDREVLRRKEAVDIPEERLQTNGRGTRILHTKKVPLLNAEGEPEYLLGISEDITDRIEAQAREREHDQQLFQASRLGDPGR